MWNKYIVNGFFGWTNIKFVIREIFYMYSDKPSVLMKKRVESGVAFDLAMILMCFWIWHMRNKLTNMEFAFDIGILLSIAGYQVNQIQKEKLENSKPDPDALDSKNSQV